MRCMFWCTLLVKISFIPKIAQLVFSPLLYQRVMLEKINNDDLIYSSLDIANNNFCLLALVSTML